MSRNQSQREQQLANPISAAEWRVRVDLAAAYRLIALFGWDDLIFTHLTATVPGTDHFLINPYGLMFREVTASSLVKVDRSGAKVGESPHRINPAGFMLHGCIHAARPDAACILHTHSVNGIAVSAQRERLLPISQQAFVVLQSLAYHDFEGIALDVDEGERIARDLGDKNFLLLRNHGLVTIGTSVANAFFALYLAEKACTIQIAAQRAGDLVHIPPEILALASTQMNALTLGEGGALAWPALLRKCDRDSPGYAD